MVLNILPATTAHRRLQRDGSLVVPTKPQEQEESERTVEVLGESFRTVSSFRRHSLQPQENPLSDSSNHGLDWDDDNVERQSRRITISCLNDFDISFAESSDRSFAPHRPRFSLPSTSRRITTKRASDIYLREQRVSETMTNRFRISMHAADLQDYFQSDDFQEDEPSEEAKVQETARKGVSFGDVEIREYGIIPGDNPGGLGGAPLTMEWDSFSCVTIKLARYEDVRQQHRREYSELVIPASHRATILKGLGFSKEDIRSASKKAAISRQRRSCTLAKLRNARTHERMERAKRTALNLVTLGYRSHSKRSYLKKHCPGHYQ